MSVGTYQIPAPESVSGSLQCTKTGRGATITITAFGLVDRATNYVATLTVDGETPTPTAISAGREETLTNWGGKGRYTFALYAQVGSWTGRQLERTINC